MAWAGLGEKRVEGIAVVLSVLSALIPLLEITARDRALLLHVQAARGHTGAAATCEQHRALQADCVLTWPTCSPQFHGVYVDAFPESPATFEGGACSIASGADHKC